MARWIKCPLAPSPPPTPLPLPNPLPLPRPPAQTPYPWTPCRPPCRQGRQGGQGRIDDITGKGLRAAVALSTASCCAPVVNLASETLTSVWYSRRNLPRASNCAMFFGVASINVKCDVLIFDGDDAWRLSRLITPGCARSGSSSNCKVLTHLQQPPLVGSRTARPLV